MDLFQEIEEKNIIVNGLNLHTIIIGKGKPMILLHGFPDFWYGWKNIILDLKDSFKLIIPDLRGINLSDKPKKVNDYSVNYLVEDIKSLSEKCEFNNGFYLVGHDWGGIIGWCFAEKYPNLIKKLIILNSPHPKIFQEKLRTDKEQQKASRYIFHFLKPNGEKYLFEDNFAALKLAVFGTSNDSFLEEDKVKYLEAWSKPGALEAGVNYYRANMDFRDWSGIIKVPTLVIWGMKDIALTPQVLDGIEQYVSDLKIIKSENASHWIMFDDPELIISSIKEYIS